MSTLRNGLLDELFNGEARHQHHDAVWLNPFNPQERFYPVHARHLDIHEYQGERLVVCLFDGIEPIFCHDDIVAIVREGLSGKSMPSFRAWMSDDEIREIAAYLRQRAGS